MAAQRSGDLQTYWLGQPGAGFGYLRAICGQGAWKLKRNYWLVLHALQVPATGITDITVGPGKL